MAKIFQKKKKVAVAMSGGVDSGVAAALLVKQGYEVTGFHLQLWKEKTQNAKCKIRNFEDKCCDRKGLETVRKTAWKLGIPFYVLDFERIFKRRVVDYFLKEYAAGRTPNPCVMCNKYIKFGELLDYIRKLGFDYLATGHYARICEQIQNPIRQLADKIQNPKLKNYHLLEAKDKSKDQSYFLYNLNQRQLACVLFPVGEYAKEQVREMAKKWGLAVAERPESQEICFFPESDYRLFLQRQIPEKIAPGEVVDAFGQVVGRHFGLPLYTIGQRHGFEINLKSHISNLTSIPPFYVVGKDVKKNRLIIGFGKEAEQKEFWVEKVNWIVPDFKFQDSDSRLFVRIRHQGELLKCKFQNPKSKMKIQNSKLKIILEEPYRGIAPGQAAVFYRLFTNHYSLITNYEVLGGGVIKT